MRALNPAQVRWLTFSILRPGHSLNMTTGNATVPTSWDALRAKLATGFPDFAPEDVLAEILHAHQAVEYVGTPEAEQLELVEFMARYGLLVRSGRITPSDRLDPERHASPRRQDAHA
jgi:hypothetical protein